MFIKYQAEESFRIATIKTKHNTTLKTITHPSVLQSVHSFVHSFVYPFVCPFVHSSVLVNMRMSMSVDLVSVCEWSQRHHRRALECCSQSARNQALTDLASTLRPLSASERGERGRLRFKLLISRGLRGWLVHQRMQRRPEVGFISWG